MKIEERILTHSKLTDPKKVVLNLLFVSAAIKEQVAHILKPYGISGPQFNVLRILRGRKEKPANLETIQERMIHKSSNTSRLVDKLLEKKLVERTTCPKNRRKVDINITEKGLVLLNEINPKINEVDNNINKGLSKEEMRQLISLLEKIGDKS